MTEETQPKNAVTQGQPDSEQNSVMLLAIPVLGAVFGSNAFAIGGWIICLHNTGCKPEAKAEGGLVVLLIGFLLLTCIGAYVAYRERKGSDAVVAGAAAALVAGVFSALDSLDEKNGLPDPATLEYVFFILVAATLFVVPTFARPYQSLRWPELNRLYGRMALAALVAGILTLLLQGLPDLVGDSWVPGRGVHYYEPTHPSFFLVRPMGIGTIMAAWILLTYDPMLNPSVWRATSARCKGLWIACFWMVAVALACAYALIFYWDRNSGGRLAQGGISAPGTSLVFIALLLAPLAAAGVGVSLAVVRPGHPFGMAAVFRPETLLSTAVACAGSIVVGVVLLAQIEASVTTVALFVAYHALTATITLLVALFFAVRWSSSPAAETA